ncbi:MAG TPA: glutamine synthetase family protein [Polaromonas sp.]|uniref:glutamine synthetase family protein n=1 Tax=Polaromonas sp. TaxID=1869339 RepID=UPI002D33F3D4|nr:glutamine synthetase family protein [Polaromonas sp.]HYW58011.1 glutamine synthetase family protein [Polaromonas sp.]
MNHFAAQCGVHDEARQRGLIHTEKLIAASGVELVRFAWCDLHGNLRGKTLVASAAANAMLDGVGLVSTLLLKDTSDRTAFKVFEAGGTPDLPGFEFASNLMLLADPASYRQLPWARATGWVQGQTWTQDGGAVELDTRRILQAALAKLAQAGFGMKCGLEIEFHIYRITGDGAADALDPEQADWPGPAPKVVMIHPGYQLLSETWADMAEEPLRIVQHTAQALGLPLHSLEIEFGPSQVEAVFEATDALTAADNMVLFRSAVKQALRRAGYHASFMCRPPFPNIMSSGWHLHQSLVDLQTGANLFMRDTPAPGSQPSDAQYTLSALGEHFLAGLLAHAEGMTVFCTPTINGFGRFQPNALAPQSVLWGRDNRGAMLRVVGQCQDKATRIENRIGEPAANPYLYLASQIYAGLDGLQRELTAPKATDAPYGDAGVKIPSNLGDALRALQADQTLVNAFGSTFINYLSRIKQSELTRYEQAADQHEWQRREYFSRL